MTILVLGARGQLGTAVVRELANTADVVPFNRSDLDIVDDRRVAERIGALRPSAIVNCAAYNDVDGAEDDPVTALEVNAMAVRALARAATDCDAAFIHYSSDFVFDGVGDRPYTEDDRPSPQSAYATSKLLGEWFAADAPRHYVLRVESLFGAEVVGAAARGSVATIARTMQAGGEARVFEDRTVSPSYVVDVARATRGLLENRAPTGLYHCVNSGSCTWLQFAQELARQLGTSARICPVRMREVTFRAHRPLFCALSNAKLGAVGGVTMPSWQDAVARYAGHLRGGA